MPDDKGNVVASQVDQIGEILGNFAGEPAAAPAAATPAVVDPAKPAELAKPAEPVAAEPAKPAEPVKDEKDVAIETLVEQVKALTTKVTELSTPKPAEPMKPVEPAPVVSEFGYFKDKAEYEKAFEDPKVMTEVMQRVETNAVGKMLKTLPQVINNVVKAQIEVQTKTAKFYTDNDDLTKDLTPEQVMDRKKFIGYVANDISGKNPDWTLDKLFVELPKEVKTRLGMKVVAAQPSGPAQPSRKGGARMPVQPASVATPLETEIADLMI
jgi:hypothetical protein